MPNKSVLMSLGFFMSYGLVAHAHMAQPQVCEAALVSEKAYDQLLSEAAALEERLLDLTARSTKNYVLRILKGELDAQIDSLLGKSQSAERLREELEEISHKVEVESAEPLQEIKPTARPRTILDFVKFPQELFAGGVVEISNQDSYIVSASFAGELLANYWDIPPAQQAKFLRAIYNGAVGPVGKSGIKRLQDIHRDLVEVKILGTGTRLLGCLQRGHLTVLKLLLKHSDHGKGNLSRFRHLCG